MDRNHLLSHRHSDLPNYVWVTLPACKGVSRQALAAGSGHDPHSGQAVLASGRSREPAASALPLTGRRGNPVCSTRSTILAIPNQQIGVEIVLGRHHRSA